MNSLYDFSKAYNTDIQEALNGKIGMNMNSLLYGYRNLSRDEKRLIRKKLSYNKHLFKSMRQSKSTKYRIEGIIFGFNVHIGFFFHGLIR